MNEKYKKNILEEITLQSTKEILCTSMEECCELAQAISKYICDFNEKSENLLIKENIAKEMAHVQICMEKVKEICGISDESIEEWIEEKTATSKRQILNRMKKNSRQKRMSSLSIQSPTSRIPQVSQCHSKRERLFMNLQRNTAL